MANLVDVSRMSKVAALIRMLESTEVLAMADAAPLVKGLHTDDGVMKHWIESPDSSTAPSKAVLAYDGGKVIGWAGVGQYRKGRNSSPLLSVFVDPKHRGKGLGKSLAVAALDGVEDDGYIYHDPNAPQLGQWIEDAGYDPMAIPQGDFE